jgi:hypothetical protein
VRAWGRAPSPEPLRRDLLIGAGGANQRDAGFSMIEASIVIVLTLLIAGFALIDVTGITPGTIANTGLHQTVAQLRSGRETAIAQRRNIELSFPANNQIRLVRLEVPVGRTVLSTVTLESRLEFRLFGGVPDTPDGFGNGNAVSFAGPAPWTFLSNGTLVDAQGNPLNGSVFLGLANQPETARAITILGATGRVRGYRWTRSAWIQ